jgi:hypothetical protein
LINWGKLLKIFVYVRICGKMKKFTVQITYFLLNIKFFSNLTTFPPSVKQLTPM